MFLLITNLAIHCDVDVPSAGSYGMSSKRVVTFLLRCFY